MASGIESAEGTIPRSLRRARSESQRWSERMALRLLLADNCQQSTSTFAGLLAGSAVSLTTSANGAHALHDVGKLDPDIIVLTLPLRVVPADTVVETVRCQSDVPILIGAGPGDDEEAGRCLLNGADNLLVRPYREKDLRPQLEGLFAQAEERRAHEAPLTYGPLTLRPRGLTAHLDGQRLDLRLKEFELLHLLVMHAERIVTPKQIQTALWADGDAPSSNAIAVYVVKLRSLLGGSPVLQTVRGSGYRLRF